jgi:hypothetical protein
MNRNNKENQKSLAMVTDSINQYGYNLNFLKKYVSVIELKKGNSAIALVPAWQGRVMTSTADGDKGFSFGWINSKLIASGKILEHMNAFGGEERLWLGPEGGQFSIYFRKGEPFTFEKWQVPSWLDTEPFELVEKSDTSATFAKESMTENYSGTSLKFRIERKVTLLSGKSLAEESGINTNGVQYVAYRSSNRLINKGDSEWTIKTGMLSVWMLGMFNPSPSVVIVIPYNKGEETALGPVVNDSYFGKISPDRLKISDNHIFFRADGKSRGKIGLPPLRNKGVMGSYDSANNILTLLISDVPAGIKEYVNSAWEIQKDPFSGDAVNSYNDGPLEDGSQMGPFYELEASSPAAALKPGGQVEHSQITCHLTGDKTLLDKISVSVLGIPLTEIENAFK